MLVARKPVMLGEQAHRHGGRHYFADTSYDLIPGTPEEFSRYQAEELARWSAVAKAANVKVE